MDKENIKFTNLLTEIEEKLGGKKCVPFSYPIGKQDSFDGFVNIVDLKARKYNGKECVDDVIYDDKNKLFSNFIIDYVKLSQQLMMKC